MRPISTLAAVACALVFVAVSLHDHHQLPERIASHFDATGTVNGWMDKTAFTTSMLAVGLGIPALLVAVIYLMRFLPTQYLNLPSDYWREPVHFRKACDYFLTITLWYSAAFLLWQTAFIHLIVAANLASPPRLDGQTGALYIIRFSSSPSGGSSPSSCAFCGQTRAAFGKNAPCSVSRRATPPPRSSIDSAY